MTERRPLILVVEDDPSVQGLLTLLLEGEGYDVIAAKDGLEGLVKLELQHPALLILDLMMPNISGDRVLEEIRSDPRLKSVPVLVVSGRHDAHATFDPILGRENVFPKPLDPERLLGRVARILEETA
ncbi:MAG TPA: response regulator [Actinomycetota bacterium]|nr:response regulator [Actinomycetota bacterium]